MIMTEGTEAAMAIHPSAEAEEITEDTDLINPPKEEEAADEAHTIANLHHNQNHPIMKTSRWKSAAPPPLPKYKS
jgi:hypothetical protein